VLRIVDSSVRTVAPRAALAGFARFGDMVAAGGTLRRLSALYLLALATVGAVLVGLIIAAKSNAFVRSREHDIAVRIAVGATGASVVRYLALRQMPWMISAAVVGALLAFIGGRLVQHWSPVLDEFSSGTYAAGMCGVVAYVSMATLWSLWRAVSRIPAVLNTRPS
jgi:predicted lysophospholipase L1 biosynthesis ABC-type transport system permease subunit